MASVRALGYATPVAAASGLTLAQIGEFSFVLDRAGQDVGLSPAGLGETGSQAFIAASVMLMVVTPQLAALGRAPGRAARTTRAGRRAASRRRGAVAPRPSRTCQQHVIVAGYGEAARSLVRVLHGSHVPFVITTLSPGGALEAEAAGLPVLRGDSARQHTLLAAGVDRATMVVIADDDPAMAHRIVAVARSLAPTARIVVRTRYQTEAAALEATGADLVVVEELESVVQLFADVMRTYTTDRRRSNGTQRPSGTAAMRRWSAADDEETTGHEPEIAQRHRSRPGRSRLMPTSGTCAHVARIQAVRPSAQGCEDCLRIGAAWVHLRLCMTCGHVGCCDTSPNRHATKHFHATTIRSCARSSPARTGAGVTRTR